MGTGTGFATSKRPKRTLSFRKAPYYAVAFLPLPLVNFALERLVESIGAKRPEIFRRLDGHHHKNFLIDPTNLPFVLCLRPDPRKPELRAYRRRRVPVADGRIAGSFLTLLGMIDGRYDGDALFFTRNLRVEGDTEAIVCLNSALDDMEGGIADDVAAFFGTAGEKFLGIARRISDRVGIA